MLNKFTLGSFLTFLLLVLFSISPIKVEANWIKISDKAIVPVGPNNAWDKNRVGSASITFDGSLFKMWYEGVSGLNWRIGYATSPDGIIWNKYPSYIIDTLDSGDNFNVHDPKVMFINNKFKMWYAASNSFINNIHINYAESLNGINWNSSLINILSASLSWERDISFPYTIFIANQYKMWYAARGSLNGSTRWRIGYATSPDGLNWTKTPLPVITATFGWEGADVANPSVLFDETTGIYEMFYHGDFGIGRATSTDGINWTKDPANPILTPTAGTFDSQRVFNPFVLKKDGIYYMWYTGVDSEGKWQIGLATSEPIPTSLPTATPTTSPTPSVTPEVTSTPTPSSTPTLTSTLTPAVSPTITPMLIPSPTPTINQTLSPIIIIPGLGASWNPKDIFSCSTETGGKWELAPYVSLYNRLVKTLTDNAHLRLNQDVYLYTYDWRQPLDKQAENFKKYLENILTQKPAGTKARLVGHSLGGLVIRSYLANNSNSHHILSAITVGTPHLGTLAAYPIWEKGEITIPDLLLQITINQVIVNCKVVRTFILPQRSIPIIKFRTSREIVQYFIPVVKQLLPVFNYLRQGNQIKDTSALINKNDWITSHPFPVNHFNIDFSTLSGNNADTLRFFDITNSSIRESVFGDWVDGKPVGSEKINSGDGTVLNSSSQIDGTNNQVISGNHVEIIYSDAGIEKILNFLGLTNIPVAQSVIPSEETSQNALTVSLSNDAKMKITDPRGNLIEAKENIFVSYNPSVGLYRVEILPGKTADAYLHLSEIVKREEPQTQSIPIHLTKNRPSRFYLIYNPLTSSHIQLVPF